MPLKEAEKNYDFKKIEEKVQNFWADSDIYEKTNMDSTADIVGVIFRMQLFTRRYDS